MICYNPVLFNEYRNTKSCWNVLGVTISELTWLSFWNVVDFLFLCPPPPRINMLHICKIVSLHYTKISKWEGLLSFVNHQNIFSPDFFMIFLSVLFPADAPYFKRKYFDVDMILNCQYKCFTCSWYLLDVINIHTDASHLIVNV